MQQTPINHDADDHAHIDTDKEFEITYWSRKFGVTKASLRQVIVEVGNRAADVRGRIEAGSQSLAA
jgi:Protein of unknown function (DUF3606)